MISTLLLLFFCGGLPYYLYLEKHPKFNSKSIFYLSSFLLLCGILLSLYIPNEHNIFGVLLASASALYSIYRATQTTNFYKLAYYLIYVNAPFFMLFETQGSLYSFSMLVSLAGLFLIGNFYEKNYGSANYLSVRGITLTTPCVGTYLTLYLIAIALYPPFPNALFFLSYVLNAQTDLLSYAVMVTIFGANFFLVMRVMKTTLFGRANPNIHYVHMSTNDKILHSFIVAILLILSLYGLKEMLL